MFAAAHKPIITLRLLGTIPLNSGEVNHLVDWLSRCVCLMYKDMQERRYGCSQALMCQPGGLRRGAFAEGSGDATEEIQRGQLSFSAAGTLATQVTQTKVELHACD